MIQANPTLATLRRTRFVMFFGSAVLVVATLVILYITLISYINNTLLNDISALSWLIFLLVACIVMLVTTSWQRSYWQRIEQRRFAAVQRDQTLLASEQPPPNAASLPLPVTIKLRYRKESFPLMQGAPILIAALLSLLLNFVSLLALSLPLSSPHRAPLLVPIAILVTFLILGIATTAYLPKQASQLLEVTVDGLTSRSMGQASSIRWNEARLFARYRTFGAQQNGAAITYELSSASDIVRWIWIRRKTYTPGLEPLVPLADHNQQMQALLSLVAAKTKLALYDLNGVHS